MKKLIATTMAGLACLVVLAVGAMLIYEFLKDIDIKNLDNPTETTTLSHILTTSETDKATTAEISAVTRTHERSSSRSSGQPPTSVSQTYSPPAKETTAIASSTEQTSSTERATTAASSDMTLSTDRATTANTSPFEQHGSSSVLTSLSAQTQKTTQPITTSQPMTTSQPITISQPMTTSQPTTTYVSTDSNSNANESTVESTTFLSNQQERSTEAASTSASSEQLVRKKETGSTADNVLTVTSSAIRGEPGASTQTKMPIEDLFPGQPIFALWDDAQSDSD